MSENTESISGSILWHFALKYVGRISVSLSYVEFKSNIKLNFIDLLKEIAGLPQNDT